jgi:uncharacterized protein YjdB
MFAIRSVCIVATLLVLGTGVACKNSSRNTSSGNPAISSVGFSIESSARDLMVGETVTLTARTENTYGRDSEVKWTSTAGKVTTEQNGRIARVQFDQPGTYTVTGVLLIDGRETRRDSVEVRVRPLS